MLIQIEDKKTQVGCSRHKDGALYLVLLQADFRKVLGN